MENRERGGIAGWFGRFRQDVCEAIYPEVTNSTAAKLVDGFILLLIVVSVAIVFAVTFDLPPKTLEMCRLAENVIVCLFVGEYVLRLMTADLHERSQKKTPPTDGEPASSLFGRLLPFARHIYSPMAIIDMLAILPSFLPLFLPEGLLGIRALRLFRLVRIFKASQHLTTLSAIADVVAKKARDLLAVFFFMFLMVLFLSLLMYAAEHDAQPDKFQNAFSTLGWAIDTFTKSGMRGCHPVTTAGRIIGVVISILGFCLIAIPTGIISSGLIERLKNRDKEEKIAASRQEGQSDGGEPACDDQPDDRADV